jgi:quercetin dioxygenase-like cupin family protein
MTEQQLEARVLAAHEGLILQSVGQVRNRFMIDSPETDGRFGLLQHIFEPKALAAPMHRHHDEDEYTYVLTGRIGAILGGQEVVGDPGDLIFKPRGQWHTFWNAGDEPCRILEIIAPAGFEKFFEELSDMGGALKADPEELGKLSARYELEMQPDSIPGLLERFNLVIGEPL